MGFFAGLFRKKNRNLACHRTGDRRYEYDKDSDRDIEGMPFVDGDPRSCPQYGHMCPEFMGDFGLAVDDLNILATIHCGSLIEPHFTRASIHHNMGACIGHRAS